MKKKWFCFSSDYITQIRKVTERLFTQEHKVHVQVRINSPWFGMVHLWSPLWSDTSGTWTPTGCSAKRVIQPLSTDRTVTVTFALSIKQCHISQRPRLQTLGWHGNSNTWIFEQILHVINETSYFRSWCITVHEARLQAARTDAVKILKTKIIITL